MKTYNISVIDINSALTTNLVKYNKATYIEAKEIENEADIIIETINCINDINSNDISGEKCDNDGCSLKSEHLQDINMGNIGEEYIVEQLLNQMSRDNRIVKVDRVSVTKVKESLGYDIEVNMYNDVRACIEVKSTRMENGNVIHLTNNEIRAMLRLNYSSYLVVVVFNSKNDEIKAVYKLRNFINALRLDVHGITDIISTKKLDGIQFYPQVFVVNIPVMVFDKYKIKDTENIIDETDIYT